MSETNAIPEMERDLRFFPTHNPNPVHLTTAEIDQYNAKGYIFPYPVFSADEAAGQVSLHTDLLLHGSAPNNSNRRRCGLTLRYHPPEVRRREPGHAPGIICRGGDVDDYWQHIERPDGDSIPARS